MKKFKFFEVHVHNVHYIDIPEEGTLLNHTVIPMVYTEATHICSSLNEAEAFIEKLKEDILDKIEADRAWYYDSLSTDFDKKMIDLNIETLKGNHLLVINPDKSHYKTPKFTIAEKYIMR